MVAKFLEADLLWRKQNRKTERGKLEPFLNAKQSRADQKSRNNKNQSEQKGIKKEWELLGGNGSVIN
jgi:hypothetical protein